MLGVATVDGEGIGELCEAGEERAGHVAEGGS